MIRQRHVRAHWLALACILAGVTPALAATYHVATRGNDEGPGTMRRPWASPQRALTAAVTGDTILLHGGRYRGGFEIAQPIELRAVDGRPVTIDGEGERVAVTVSSSDVTLHGIHVTNTTRAAILVKGEVSGVAITDCTLNDNALHGILLTRADRVLVERCLIHDNGGSGIHAINRADDLAVRFSTIWGNGSDGINTASHDTIVDSSIVANNGAWGIDTYSVATVAIDHSVLNANRRGPHRGDDRVDAGNANLSLDPLLTDPERGDFRLRANSPAIGSGSGGNDIGVPSDGYGPALNQAPSVTVGDDVELIEPANIVLLLASASDDGFPTPGTPLQTQWVQIAGPTDAVISQPKALTSLALLPLAGIYRFRFSASDGDLEAAAEMVVSLRPRPANQPPLVRAGPDRTASLEAPTITVVATVDDDGLPDDTPPQLLWRQLDGPAPASIASPREHRTEITFPAIGDYRLRLSADDGELIGFDDIEIRVSEQDLREGFVAGDAAGWDLGQPDVLLQSIYGTAQDSAGRITANTPVALSRGKGVAVAFDVPDDTALDTISLKLQNLKPNVGIRVRLYDVTFRGYLSGDHRPTREAPGGAGNVTIFDQPFFTGDIVPHHSEAGFEGIRYSELIVPMGPLEILSGEYLLVIDNAGPSNTAGSLIVGDTVEAPMMDEAPDGTLLPAPATIVGSGGNANAAYFKLPTRDVPNYQPEARLPALQITTTIVNHAPEVNAGADQLVLLPQSIVELDGSVTDDGHPSPPGAVTLEWRVTDGPGSATFDPADRATTTARLSELGTYELTLSADDSELNASDTVLIRWLAEAPPNQPPHVDVGPNRSVTLPRKLHVEAHVDDDGEPDPPAQVLLQWTTSEGPAAASFASPNAATTEVSFPEEGSYTLRLTADDGQHQSFDELVVEVAPFGRYEGYGAGATGGAGGKIVLVTNLNDSGAGSFRNAVANLDGTPTIIQFAVGGTIAVFGEIRIERDNVTVMGSSAPPPGITLDGTATDRNLGIKASNVIVENLRLRNAARENLILWRGRDIVIDHCSITWSGDGAVDINGSGFETGVNHVTLSRNLFAGAVEVSRSRGHRISWHYNLFTNNNRRQPKIFVAGPDYNFINNYLRSWTNTGINIQNSSEVNIINNYFGPPYPGETWPLGCYVSGTTDRAFVHTAGNLHAPSLPGQSRGGYDVNEVGAASRPFQRSPIPVPVTVIPADQVPSNVTGDVGAFPRDVHDEAFIFTYNGRGRETGGSPP